MHVLYLINFKKDFMKYTSSSEIIQRETTNRKIVKIIQKKN